VRKPAARLQGGILGYIRHSKMDLSGSFSIFTLFASICPFQFDSSFLFFPFLSFFNHQSSSSFLAVLKFKFTSLIFKGRLFRIVRPLWWFEVVEHLYLKCASRTCFYSSVCTIEPIKAIGSMMASSKMKSCVRKANGVGVNLGENSLFIIGNTFLFFPSDTKT
jgi:hypothetical protein